MMKWSWPFGSLMSCAAMVLPFLAAADSHIQTAASSAALRATAHVEFKIIIPKVLYLQVGDSGPVAIMSNGRNVSLTATVRAPAANPAHGNVILSAAARKVIAQDAECTPGDLHPAAAAVGVHSGVAIDASRVVCTASMP
jgi:hypothetical protein